MINVSDIGKQFFVAGQKFDALKNINLTIKQGDFICISGASGSGKSTLLNIIAGILRPSSGKILFNETVLHEISDRKLSRFRGENIGFVYQSFNLIPRLTVYENVRAPLFFGKHTIKNSKKRIEEMLEKVGIAEKRNEYPHKLSGGQMQRVAIARALIKEPAILLADEPTGNLDAQNGLAIIKLFQKMHKEGKTILVVSHDERFMKAAPIHMQLDFGSFKKARKRSTAKKTSATKKEGK